MPDRAPAPASMPDSPANESTPSAPRSRPSKQLVASLIVLATAIAIAGYAFTGSPSLARFGVASDKRVEVDADHAREIGLQQIAAMVGKLAERMKSRPDDAEGWTMLARSYSVLGRYAEAVPAYQRATELQPNNAGLLADYADALTASAEGRAPESRAIVERALAIDPHQPKALALAGTIAFERGDYAVAAAQWQKIADALPRDSEFHQQVQANIDEARRRENLSSRDSSLRGDAASVARASADAASRNAASVSGTVSLAPALATRASPTDTVFVFARAAAGSRMPLAVFRATVAELPLQFKLDDSMAMTAAKLSDAKQVIVGARISKSGNARSQAGDLSGESAPVAPGASELAITISEVVDAK